MRKGVISTMFHDICRPSLPRKRLASSIGLERETFITRVISRLRVRVPRWAFFFYFFKTIMGFFCTVFFLFHHQTKIVLILYRKYYFSFYLFFFLVLRCGRVIGALKKGDQVHNQSVTGSVDSKKKKTKTPKKFYNKDRNKVHFNSSILLSALPFQLLCSFKKIDRNTVIRSCYFFLWISH